jgi:predicted RNA-binding Zn-ribbon protein involved in translation (DUF1610 family)
MTNPVPDTHYFDCPSCKAFATLRRLDRKGHRKTSDEYECSECLSQHGAEELDRESAKRKAAE